MGMFDWYEPDPQIRCPDCNTALSGWQSKDGPNLLFDWRQNVEGPVAQQDECVYWTKPLTKQQRRLFRLPPTFELYTECENGHRIEATGYATDGLWHHTQLRPARLFEQTTYDRLTGIANDFSPEERLFQQGLIELVDVQGAASQITDEQVPGPLMFSCNEDATSRRPTGRNGGGQP